MQVFAIQRQSIAKMVLGEVTQVRNVERQYMPALDSDDKTTHGAHHFLRKPYVPKFTSSARQRDARDAKNLLPLLYGSLTIARCAILMLRLGRPLGMYWRRSGIARNRLDLASLT